MVVPAARNGRSRYSDSSVYPSCRQHLGCGSFGQHGNPFAVAIVRVHEGLDLDEVVGVGLKAGHRKAVLIRCERTVGSWLSINENRVTGVAGDIRPVHRYLAGGAVEGEGWVGGSVDVGAIIACCPVEQDCRWAGGAIGGHRVDGQEIVASGANVVPVRERRFARQRYAFNLFLVDEVVAGAGSCRPSHG